VRVHVDGPTAIPEPAFISDECQIHLDQAVVGVWRVKT
jgi:hypothetical protein